MPVYSQRLGGPPPAGAQHGILPCSWVAMLAWRASARVREPGRCLYDKHGILLPRQAGACPRPASWRAFCGSTFSSVLNQQDEILLPRGKERGLGTPAWASCHAIFRRGLHSLRRPSIAERRGRAPRTPALAGRLVEIVRDDGEPRSPRRPDCSLRCPGSPPSSRHSAAPPSCRAWMPGSRTRAEARQANIGRMPMVRVKIAVRFAADGSVAATPGLLG